MPFSSTKHKGFVSNYTGNGVHCAGAFEYFQITDPTGTIDPITGTVQILDIATQIGFYSSDDAGANYSEIVINKGNLALSANNATLSNVTVWGSDSILTQGRGDGRYATPSCLTYTNITGTPNLSLYLTTANAATTYLPSANFTYANIGGTIPTATNTTLGAIKVGSTLQIANGVLDTTILAIDGGSATTSGTAGTYDGGSATTN